MNSAGKPLEDNEENLEDYEDAQEDPEKIKNNDDTITLDSFHDSLDDLENLEDLNISLLENKIKVQKNQYASKNINDISHYEDALEDIKCLENIKESLRNTANLENFEDALEEITKFDFFTNVSHVHINRGKNEDIEKLDDLKGRKITINKKDTEEFPIKEKESNDKLEKILTLQDIEDIPDDNEKLQYNQNIFEDDFNTISFKDLINGSSQDAIKREEKLVDFLEDPIKTEDDAHSLENTAKTEKAIVRQEDATKLIDKYSFNKNIIAANIQTSLSSNTDLVEEEKIENTTKRFASSSENSVKLENAEKMTMDVMIVNEMKNTPEENSKIEQTQESQNVFLVNTDEIKIFENNMKEKEFKKKLEDPKIIENIKVLSNNSRQMNYFENALGNVLTTNSSIEKIAQNSEKIESLGSIEYTERESIDEVMKEVADPESIKKILKHIQIMEYFDDAGHDAPQLFNIENTSEIGVTIEDSDETQQGTAKAKGFEEAPKNITIVENFKAETENDGKAYSIGKVLEDIVMEDAGWQANSSEMAVAESAKNTVEKVFAFEDKSTVSMATYNCDADSIKVHPKTDITEHPFEDVASNDNSHQILDIVEKLNSTNSLNCVDSSTSQRKINVNTPKNTMENEATQDKIENEPESASKEKVDEALKNTTGDNILETVLENRAKMNKIEDILAVTATTESYSRAVENKINLKESANKIEKVSTGKNGYIKENKVKTENSEVLSCDGKTANHAIDTTKETTNLDI